jgi:ATP-dependent RNA helicase DDX19/DBP5
LSYDYVLTSAVSLLPKDIQILLFSATFPDKVNNYSSKFAPNAHTLKLQRSELTVKGISQMYIDCPADDTKYDVLCKLYGLMTIGQSVIFVKVSLLTRIDLFEPN